MHSPSWLLIPVLVLQLACYAGFVRIGYVFALRRKGTGTPLGAIVGGVVLTAVAFVGFYFFFLWRYHDGSVAGFDAALWAPLVMCSALGASLAYRRRARTPSRAS